MCPLVGGFLCEIEAAILSNTMISLYQIIWYHIEDVCYSIVTAVRKLHPKYSCYCKPNDCPALERF